MNKIFYLLSALLLNLNLQLDAQPATWKWARSAAGNTYDAATTIVTDPMGNVIAAGNFTSDSIIFGSWILHNHTPGDDDMFVVKYDSSGNVLWALSIGDSLDDRANCLATDAAGNIYLSGYFYSPVITIGTYTFTNAGNVGDILLARFDPQGNLLWATREGGPALEVPHALTVDNAGNMIAAGRFSSTNITFGSTTLNLAGSMDVFVVKYNSSGNVVWAKGAGSGGNDEAYSVITDAVNDVVVTGYFTGNCSFGSVVLSTAGSNDMFLAKYDGTTGMLLWAKRYGGSTADEGKAIAIDASGQIYVTGTFQSATINFGSTMLNNFFSAGVNNAFIAKFYSPGDALWAHAINGRSSGQGIALYNNHVYTCGNFNDDSLNYGNNVLMENGSSDFYLTHCDTSGNSRWALYQNSGGGSSDFAVRLAADGWGNVALAGYFNSSPFVFGPSTLSATGNFDMYVARLGSISTGISPHEAPFSFSVFPNPASDFLTFSIPSCADLNVVIINTIGEKVLHVKGENRISISNLSTGIYFLNIEADGRTHYRKFVKY